ncbi:alpha/beta fold hydrolase [Asticcacaulis sp. AND118]|uniref:alpha/beta fold hydrolase n=1 Tax=Asticcacaulis sp. AND118 TaxID=2840468 RepID=UPI001CFFB67D|nr:alpha/beta hydrolase [Asticcacaulis sp. AND118]UDF05579.1 alpha/beta hydrolase [Asticcacaulis sp. AND118]
MPLILIARLFTSLLSWILLAALLYFGWSWYQGELFRSADGDLVRIREDWRLWVVAFLMAWSVFGGFILHPILAHPDRRILNTARGEDGHQISDTNGASLYMETHGHLQAPPLILTHGWGMDSTIWGYAKDDFSDTFRVIAWDLPGMGRSKTGSGGITLAAFAISLKQVIEQTAEEKVILVGHSIGGMVVQTLARDFPAFFEARVAGTVLINTTYTNPLRTMLFSRSALTLQKPLIEPMMWLTRCLMPFAWVNGWQSYFNGATHLANRIGFGPRVTRSQLKHTALLSTRNSPGAQARGNLAMFAWDASEALRTVTGPVLVIGSKGDLVTKAIASETIATSAPSGHLLLVEAANHMGFLEEFEIYNEAIVAFAHQTQRGEMESIRLPRGPSPYRPIVT